MTDEHAIAAEAAREDQERTAKRRRRWGCLLYVGIAFLLPVVVLVAVGSILVAFDAQALSSARDRARDAGDPLTPEAMYALYKSSPENEAATERWLAVLEAVTPIADLPQQETNVPLLGSYAAKETRDERGLYDEATLSRVEPFLAGPAAEPLRLAHAGRNTAGDVEYPIEFEQGWNASRETLFFPGRALTNLLVLEAEAHASRGDADRATESLLTLLAFSESLDDAPDFMAQALRQSSFGVAVDAAMRLIDRAEFSPENLTRLQQAFARQSFRRQMILVAQAEQYNVVRFYRGEEPSGVPDYDRLRTMPLRGADQAMILDMHRQFLAAADDGWIAADRAAAEIDARAEALRENRWERFRYALALDTAVMFPSLVNGSLRCEAQARMAEACCACERYRQEHGGWPPTLETLVPEYLAAVPLDPVDDQPLRYAVDGEKMIIHSLVHFRPENSPGTRTFGDGLASHVLGDPYVPEPLPPPPSDDPYSEDPYSQEPYGFE